MFFISVLDTSLRRPKVHWTSLDAVRVVYDHLPKVCSRALSSVNGAFNEDITVQTDSISSHLVSTLSEIQVVNAQSTSQPILLKVRESLPSLLLSCSTLHGDALPAE